MSPRLAVGAVIAGMVCLAAATASTQTPNRECTGFRAPQRLSRGQGFSVSIAGGLEFQLIAQKAVVNRSPVTIEPYGWFIRVGLGADNDLDFIDPLVAEHYQPERYIGRAYDVTTRQSAEQSPRTIHFVVSKTDYDAAKALRRPQQNEVPWTTIMKKQQELGRGTLVFKITGFEINDALDAVEWMTFEGEACVVK